MSAEGRIEQIEPCPASRDWAYITANSALWLLGAFGVFLPVLRLRVCPNCKANELGICPFFAPR
jgi:hypothetical protein